MINNTVSAHVSHTRRKFETVRKSQLITQVHDSVLVGGRIEIRSTKTTVMVFTMNTTMNTVEFLK